MPGAKVDGKPSLKELVAVNLRYEAGSEALSVRAVAQLVAKLLYASGRLVSKAPKDLAKEAAKVLRSPRVPLDLVDRGLAFLTGSGITSETRGRWQLTDYGYDLIDRDVRRASERLDGALARHFPSRIDRPALRSWFQDACVDFYSIFGTQWAAALARRSSPQSLTAAGVESLLRNTIGKHHLNSESEALSAGFHTFIASQHPEDIEHNWSLGQALLASRLVAINVGPDPLTSAEFRDCLLLLDTNTLIATALEAHRLAGHLNELGKALEQIGATLAYVAETREEYTRVVSNRRTQVLRVVDRYSTSVLRGSGDDFINTALERHCVDSSDFETFFDEIALPPETVSDHIAIETLDDSVVRRLAEAGRGDERLKNEIQTVWERLRSRKKGASALAHDAALTRVAEGLRAQGRRCAVLTLDRTMHEHARQRAGSVGVPAWLSLDALIQILAVDGAGPNVDPTEFAPLMASIIRHQCEPVMGTYDSEDLSLMLEVEERCADLSEDSVKTIATTVSRELFSGKRKTDPELQLVIRRAFSKSTLKVAEDNAKLQSQLQQTEAAVRSRDIQVTAEHERVGIATSAFVRLRAGQIRRLAYWRLAWKGLMGMTGSGLLAVAAYKVARLVVPTDWGADFVALFATFLTPSLGSLGWVAKRVVPNWRSELKSADQRAGEEMETELTTAGED